MISAEQVISSLQLQRLKLVPFDDNTDDNSCCNQIDLQDSEEDLDCIKRCFEEASKLTMSDKSSLYIMSGYVARKEGIQCLDDTHPNLPELEFTTLLTRGELSFPPEDLYDLSLYVAPRFSYKRSTRCTIFQDLTFLTRAALIGGL